MRQAFSTSSLERGPHVWLYLAVGAWLILEIAAPLLRSTGHWLGEPIYFFFSAICHQKPERSFHLFGEQLAACHRCTGLYLGFFLGLLALPRLPRLTRWLLQRPARVVLFAVPMLIDVGLYTLNTFATRFLTGLVAAFPIALLAWVAVEQLRKPLAVGVTDSEGVL